MCVLVFVCVFVCGWVGARNQNSINICILNVTVSWMTRHGRITLVTGGAGLVTFIVSPEKFL